MTVPVCHLPSHDHNVPLRAMPTWLSPSLTSLRCHSASVLTVPFTQREGPLGAAWGGGGGVTTIHVKPRISIMFVILLPSEEKTFL